MAFPKETILIDHDTNLKLFRGITIEKCKLCTILPYSSV